jgi:hypothetical protein
VASGMGLQKENEMALPKTLKNIKSFDIPK